jgi:hypothetical protein
MGGSFSTPSTPNSTPKTDHHMMLSNIDQMFKSQNAMQGTDMPYTDIHKFSSTSAIDVSTLRPPMVGGGDRIVYTRNRYKAYENKLGKVNRNVLNGGDPESGLYRHHGGAPAPVPAPVPAPAPAPVRAPAQVSMKPSEERLTNLIDQFTGMVGDDAPVTPQSMYTQMGGMPVDAEIENIRSLLLKTQKVQNGGNMYTHMDSNLKTVRDNLLTQGNQHGGSFSATSEAPIDYNLLMKGGADVSQVFSATSEAPIDYNNMMKGGADVSQVFSATSQNPVDYNLAMRGGGNKKDKKKKKDDDDDDDDDDNKRSSSTSNSSSSYSYEDDTSYSETESSSDNEIGFDTLKRLQSGINKRQNRSNFLRGDYVLTSNSEREYKVDARPYYSSQSSEFQNEVASEFLNTLRSRNRS